LLDPTLTFVLIASAAMILLTALAQAVQDPRLASFVASGAIAIAIGVVVGSAL
jgi:hypothetical protein